MWTLAIFLLSGGPAQLTYVADRDACLAAYQSQTTDGTISPANVERAMCTPPIGPAVWIVKPASP